MLLGSGIAMAVEKASGYSYNSTSGLGTSICRSCSPKKNKKREGEGFLFLFCFFEDICSEGEKNENCLLLG